MKSNVAQLVIRKASVDLIPAGASFADGAANMAKPGNLQRALREAKVWVDQAIAAVKSAPNNPYGTDDEEIAAVILKKLEEKRNE